MPRDEEPVSPRVSRKTGVDRGSLLIIYLISSWLPTLLHNTGVTLSRASWVTATFQIGGTLGAIILGQLMDRFGACRTLAIAYVIGAAFIILCGASVGQLWLLVLAVFGVGFCISGSQVGANALAAAFYPTSNRATGVSYANAAGRCGSVVGSLSGGWLMSMQLDMDVILSLLAVPSLIAAVATGSLAWVNSRAQAQEASKVNTADSLTT